MYDEQDDDLRHERPDHQGHDSGTGAGGFWRGGQGEGRGAAPILNLAMPGRDEEGFGQLAGWRI